MDDNSPNTNGNSSANAGGQDEPDGSENNEALEIWYQIARGYYRAERRRMRGRREKQDPQELRRILLAEARRALELYLRLRNAGLREDEANEIVHESIWR